MQPQTAEEIAVPVPVVCYEDGARVLGECPGVFDGYIERKNEVAKHRPRDRTVLCYATKLWVGRIDAAIQCPSMNILSHPVEPSQSFRSPGLCQSVKQSAQALWVRG